MVPRKAFHDLGFKMGDGVVAFWKHAHKTEPIVVYSVILGFSGMPAPTRHLAYHCLRGDHARKS